MAQFIYTMRKVRKAVGDKLILDDVTLSFLPGAKIGVVGPNGAGKSTVLRIMAGLDQPSNGDAQLSPGYSVGLLEQEPSLDETKTVRENVEDAVADLRATMARFEEVSVAMGEPDADFDALLTEQGNLMEKIEHANGWELDSRIEQAMDALRCPPGDEPVTHLSGGERRRVALCRLLLEQPDLLLLDEPTNHLDAESVQWLEQHLAKYPGTILAVTHDRYFLDNVAEWILELDRGRAYPYEGNYSTYLEKKADRLEVAGKRDQKLQKRLRDELDWVRQNARGRQAKSKARLQRYEEMAGEAEKTRKLDFEEIQIPPGPRLGSVVVDVSHLDKGFEGRMLIKDSVVLVAPRRNRRRDRAERGWEDDPVQDDRRAGASRFRRGEGRRDREDQLRRPGPQSHRSVEERLAGRIRRPGSHQRRARRDAIPRVCLGIWIQGAGSAKARRRIERRRTKPAESRADSQGGWQPLAPRRADQ